MLSLVLPVYNDQENLNRILGELKANTVDHPWELIVVDDGSLEAVTLGDDPLKNWHIIHHEEQRGAGAARNSGVRQARGEHIILLSVFLHIPEDYLLRIKKIIDSNKFDIAVHVLNKPQTLQSNEFQSFLANHGDRIPLTEGVLPLKNTQFAATIMKRAVFLEVHGFDENMNHYGGHELDLAYRLDQKGYSQRIVLEQLPLERLRLENHASIKTRLKEYGSVGLPSLLKKHPELKRTILTKPMLWGIMSALGLPGMMENRISRKIEADQKLTRPIYRFYLHLIVRNAWDNR